ncbi:MAG: 50S ribosomal protein L9 [Thermodesulfobacteriota bacterium]
MKIILMQDFESLGYEGDTADVARGYARNYLIPKGIAIEASEANLKALEMRRKKILAKRAKDKEEAERVKDKLSEISLKMKVKAGEADKLYGSVTSRDIAQQLEAQGVEVDRRKIVLDEPIRSLGEFQIPIKIHPEVVATITVVLEGEENTQDESS